MAIARLCLDFYPGPSGAAAALRAALLNGDTPQLPVSYPLDRHIRPRSGGTFFARGPVGVVRRVLLIADYR